MRTIPLTCVWCGKKFDKHIGEYNRQIKRGKTNFFCTRKCSTLYGNEGRKNRPIKKECPVCKNGFWSHTGKKAATFCSRSCASIGSVTPYRRKRAQEMGRKNAASYFTLEKTAEGLRKREAWKYAALKTRLDFLGENYQFEHVLEPADAIFDLALLDHMILVEFDGPYHKGDQIQRDRHKEEIARQEGWEVVRKIVVGGIEVPACVLDDVLPRK